MTTPDGLSLSFCSGDQGAYALNAWQQLNTSVPTLQPPALFGHHAVVTIHEETEWMVITGGIDEAAMTNNAFHVWLMNLTHADIYGEEDWFQLESYNATEPCPAFVYDETNDALHKEDLWQHSVQCAPSPRRDHLSAVIGDDLYVFQGIGEELEDIDYHVYRISISNVLRNHWSGWRQIVPRDLLNATSTSQAPLRGGLWQNDDPNFIPKLVAFANNPHSATCRPAFGDGKWVQNQVWTYDFSEDSWELCYEIPHEDFNQGDYNAVVVRNNLFIVGSTVCDAKPLYWFDLETKEGSTYLEDQGVLLANQTLVAYDDAQSLNTIMVGFGPEGSDSNLGKNLELAEISYQDDISIELSTVGLEYGLDPNPKDRTGHSAVLSSTGNMYIFGGRELPVDEPLLWRINVGGTNCKLAYEINTGGSADESGDDTYYFSGDDTYYFADDDTCEDCETNDTRSHGGNGVIVIVVIVLVCSWILAIWEALDGRRRDQTGASARGLASEQLGTFPERLICDDDCTKGNVCTICLLAFRSGEVVRDLPCKHFFHKACVDVWLASEVTCPLCCASCRSLVETGASDSASPSKLSRALEWLHGDQRESAEEDGEFEMGSVYSLELQVEDNGDDVSVLSSASASGAANPGQPSSEASVEGRDRRSRFFRRHGNTGGGAVLLAADPGVVLA